MKNVLHIIDSLGRGGAETLLVNTIVDLENYNHYVCYLGGSEELLHELSNSATIYCLKFNSAAPLLFKAS